MKTEYVSVVINPAAGNGKAGSVAQSLLQKIKSSTDFEINIAFSQGKNHAKYITRKAILDGASMIIAVGGDGTINEVVNGFFIDHEPLNPLCELGIISCGTGNGYARTLNNPTSLKQQIELMLHPGHCNMDLGCITFADSDGKRVNRLFVNECQIGIGNEVASSVGKKSKILGGKISFGLAATFLAMSMKPLNLEIGYDNGSLNKYKLIGLVIGNGTECAGGMKLTPDAKLNDGLFDVLSINDMTIGQRMLNLSKVYSGTHVFSPHFSVKRCKKIEIRSDAGVSAEGDGEVLGFAPFEVEILPSAIKLKTANINNQ
jgi:YegS/Rv2252/BmrU family lipid kinase